MTARHYRGQGVPCIPDTRSTGADGGKRHADAAVVYLMAYAGQLFGGSAAGLRQRRGRARHLRTARRTREARGGLFGRHDGCGRSTGRTAVLGARGAGRTAGRLCGRYNVLRGPLLADQKGNRPMKMFDRLLGAFRRAPASAAAAAQREAAGAGDYDDETGWRKLGR